MKKRTLVLLFARFATSLYFIFRTIGCFTGSIILQKMSGKSFFLISALMLLAAMIGLLCLDSKAAIYTCIGLIGYGNSNLFSIVLSQAMLALPEKRNDVSGLMIMGIFGGTIFPILMGIASDMLASQTGAILVITLGVLYLFVLWPKLSK